MATPAAVLSILVQARGIAQTQAQLKRLNASADDTAKHTDQIASKFRGLNGTLGDFNRGMTATRNSIQLVKWPAMIAGAGAATQAVGQLAAGAVALGSAMAPLAGLAGATAVAYTAFGQAAGVAKLATLGLEDAINGQKGAMDKLSPVQREFVKQIRGLKKESRDLRGEAQRGLLPGLSEALNNITPMFQTLRPVVRATADVMGDLAIRASSVVATWRGDLLTLGKANVEIIGNIGKAAILAANAFRNVVVAAIPLTKWLSELVLNAAKWIDVQVAAARESGALAGFFDRTRSAIDRLIQIAQNLGGAFVNIGKAAFPLGDQLLTDFTKLTGKFREWTDSADGKNKIAAYFEGARKPLYELFGLVGDVGKAFLQLSAPSPLTSDLIGQLRELVPIWQEVVANTTAAFGPVFIDALGNVGKLFAVVAGTSGPLTLYVQVIGTLAGILADLFEQSPALASMTATFFGFYSVMKVLSFVIGPLVSLFPALANGIKLVIGFLPALAGAISSAATFLAANPFVLIIAGLVALGIALVIAYKKSETFRDIVNGAFGAVKAVAVATFDFLKGYFTIWFTVMKALFTAYFTAYKTIVTTTWAVVRTVTTTTWNAIKTATVAVWGALKTAASSTWGAIRDAILNPIRTAREVLNGIWSGIKGAASAAWDALKKGASDFAGGFKKIIVDAFQGAVQTIAKFAIAILDVIDKIPGVDMKGAKEAVGKAAGVKVDGKARGGAFGRTGGLVNAPITLMGEEAPRHPEYVIPTNPAYRGRAQGLLAQAAGAIGFQTGGVYSKGALADLWRRANGGLGDANLMAAIALAESGGNPAAHNPSGASGLWQILGVPFPGNVFDPLTNARMAGAKLRSQGLGAWEAYTNGSYKRFLGGGGGGVLGAIGGAISGAVGTLADAVEGGLSGLLGKLPGLGDLPDWLKGTGKYVLNSVTDWIKNKLSDPFGGGGGTAVDFKGDKGEAVKAMQAFGREMASRNLPYVYGGGHGSWGPPFDCSGFVSAILHAGGLMSSPQSTDGLKGYGMPGAGKAVTIGVRGTTGRNAHTMIQVGNTFFESGGGGNGAHMRAGWNGAFPIMRHPGGFAQGGVFGLIDPYVARRTHDPQLLNVTDPHSPGFAGWGLQAGGRYSQSDVDNLLSQIYDLTGQRDILSSTRDALRGTSAGLSTQIATMGQMFAGSQARYGKLPFLGGFKTGGVLPNDGLYYGHRGEAVIPMAAGGTVWSGISYGKTITRPSSGGSAFSRGFVDVNKNAVWDPRANGGKGGYVQKLPWQNMPGAAPVAAAAPAGDDTPYSQADIDNLNNQIADLNTQISALNDTITRLNAMIELQRQQFAEVQRNYNVSQSQYSVLAKAIADVANGQIGGRVGLGFMSPSFPGGGVRY